MPKVEIIIPSFNNNNVLLSCIDSIHYFTSEDYRINIILNGTQPFDAIGEQAALHRYYRPGENLGWTRAINFMCDKVDCDFVLMLNDDTQVLDHDNGWLKRLLIAFRDPTVAAVGPTSNFVMGLQNIFIRGISAHIQRLEVPILSGFCMLVRRSALDEVGWLDETFLDGAEDVDLSFALRDKGYRLGCCRDVFVYHHGSMTAKRVYGEWWNSRQYSDEHIMKMMRKWGVKKYYDMLQLPQGTDEESSEDSRAWLRSQVNGHSVLDVGCGPEKIIPGAVGLDRVPKGRILTEGRLRGYRSQADIVCEIEAGFEVENNSFECVTASHILEHLRDPVKFLREAHRVLTRGGRLMLLLPNEDDCRSITLDPTHLHAYSPETLDSLVGAVGGFRLVCNETFRPYDFGAIYEKVL